MPIGNGSNIPLNKSTGTLPDVSAAMLNWFLPMTFITLVKTIVDFNVVETGVEILFRGVWQPLSAQDLKMKPEGQRDWKWFRVHAEPTLILVPDQVIVYFGTQYRVKAKFDYKEYKYVEYHLVEDYTGAGPLLPITPFTFTAVAGVESVTVTWAPVVGALYYTVKYGVASGVWGTVVSSNAASPVVVENLTPDVPLFFMVEARNSVNVLDATAEQAVTPLPILGPFEITVVAGVEEAEVSWTASARATHYTVKYGLVPGDWDVIATDDGTSPFVITDLLPGVDYYVMVEARNDDGDTRDADSEEMVTPT